MLDRRDRATWGGRGGERGIGNMCFSTKDGEKVVVRVAFLFFLFYVYMSFDSQSLKGRREGYFG